MEEHEVQYTKSTKRAERRHHYYRLKKKRKAYHGFDPTEPTGVHTHRLVQHLTEKEIQKILGSRVSTCQMCSCIGCGNPRNHIKSIITIKEHIALYTYADGIEEYFGWRPKIRKYTSWY